MNPGPLIRDGQRGLEIERIFLTTVKDIPDTTLSTSTLKREVNCLYRDSKNNLVLILFFVETKDLRVACAVAFTNVPLKLDSVRLDFISSYVLAGTL